MTSFQCPLCCGRTFCTRIALKYHLQSEVENVTCPECKQRFDRVQELTAHLDVPCLISGAPIQQGKDANSSDYIEETLENAGNANAGNANAVPNDDEPSNVDVESVIAAAEISVAKDADVPEASKKDSAVAGDNTTSTATHFCSTCNVQIFDIMEHITTYHPYDTIYYENEDTIIEEEAADDGEDEEVEDTDGSGQKEDVEEEQEESQEEAGTDDPGSSGSAPTVHKTNSLVNTQHDYALVNNSQIKRAARKITPGTPVGKGVQAHKLGLTPASLIPSGKIKINRDLSVRKVDPLSPGRKVNKNELNKVGSKLDFDNGSKLLPAELKLLQKSEMVDGRTGIPYTRKVIQIEKFWEKDSFKSDQNNFFKLCSEMESPECGPAKKKRVYTPRIKPVVKEHTTMSNVESHLEDLLKGGASISVEQVRKRDLNVGKKKNKKYVLKKGVFVEDESKVLCDDVEEELDHAETHSSVTTIENIQVNFNKSDAESMDTRTSVLKFVQDSAGENMIPVYTCSVCTREYSSIRGFQSHTCKAPRVYVSVICTVCGYKCKNKKNLDKHMVIHEPGYLQGLSIKKIARMMTAPVTCDVCNTEFTTENGLRMHKKMHRPDNLKKVAEMNNKIEFCCDLCNLVCYSERTLRIHYKIHFPNDRDAEGNAVRPFQVKEFGSGHLSCKLCLANFPSNDELRSHWTSHHAPTSGPADVATEETVEAVVMVTDEETFMCDECGKVLSESVRQQHATIDCGQYKFTCSTGTCNRHFKSLEELAMHSQCHAAEQDFSCSFCQMKFCDESTLRQHVSRHKTQVERPYPCGFCGRRFGRPHEKVKHEWIHTGHQPYACKVCGMRFRVAYCLKTHERIHTGVRPYTCEHCGKSFRTCSGHRAHVRIHSDLRGYKCKLCYKAFKTPIQLAGHRKSHTKPYSCTVCSRRFANMFMLRAHMARHSNNYEAFKHKCHVCGASYGREYALKDHIKTHGKNAPPRPQEEIGFVEEEVSQQSTGSEATNDS